MNFDAIAPHYRWLEALFAAGQLQRARLAFLPALKDCRHALLVGEGQGRFLMPLLRACPRMRITCMDASARMLAPAQAGVKALGSEAVARCEFVVADVRDWPSGGRRYDAIVSHFFFDCFQPHEVAALVPMLANLASPQALWLIADFTPPDAFHPRSLHAIPARLLLGLLYAFFGRTTALKTRRLTVPDPYLTQAGFHLQDRRALTFGLLNSACWRRHAA